ncbi:rCG31873 [Rattus norvegicus]|uniref:RCG31873 n=1 Tax=Rattus norvegicus TaxID=10116 RepID=A6JNE3_RAT|nr:rCG31873 [Rattus norvegicus]
MCCSEEKMAKQAEGGVSSRLLS